MAQALGRSVSVIADDAPVLRAVGMTRTDLTLASALVHLPAGLVAVLTAAVSALVASVWFPVGVAARVDPDRGVQADWAILLAGLLVLLVLVLAAAAVTSAVAIRRRPAASARDTAAWLARARGAVPLAVGIGTTMALRAGACRSRVPVRPALVGAVVGVLGVTGALTITRGLEDTLDHPERAGVVWDAETVPQPDQVTASGVRRGYLDDVAAVDGVADTSIIERALVEVEGVGEPAYAVRSSGTDGSTPVALSLTTGRAPSADDEVAVGPATALGDAVGDRSEDVVTSATPPELTNLREIRTLPTLLAAFLAAIAVVALAHVLATSARRRRHEFAVLRALGVTRRSVRSVLNAQGSTVGLIGLVVGVPLGVAVGRLAWRVVAERVPLAVVEPFALVALVLVVPVTVLVANLAALWPGRRVARQRPAAVLRTE